MALTMGNRQIDRAIDVAATDAFAERYGEPNLGPVCVVIAAYREAQALGPVLDALPVELYGKRISILVVDDGSDDGTADVAEQHGAFTCRVSANRGQGAALRLGYQLAARYQAEHLVTTDADGQYSPDDIADVLAPVVDGRADFVSGSRRLGRTYHGDTFRYCGVIFYAWLVSLLIRQRITDPSFGLRALRVEVARSVDLRQPQFQASELLIGTAMRGFRIAEVPATMRTRTAGRSRKGNDLLYGARFGWVISSTWWRERTHRPR
jgi:glycosyltransferase involved in cell wall biosynthesis